MAEQSTKFQTVFLIDIATLKEYLNRNQAEIHKFIILSAFRILYFYQSHSKHFNCDSEHTGKKHDHLKWGFKFFDSSSYKVGTKQPNLREFKMRFFDEFEKEVENIICKLKDDQSSSTLKCQKSSKLPCPADNVSKAFKEILYDFQWESTEFFSPMKGRKNQPQLSHKTVNTVFLFSKVPKTSQDLRSFCGKKVMDEDVFMDSFMSSSLFEMFHLSSRLSLFWIDTDYQTELLNCDKISKAIIDKSLQKIGGCCLTLRSLLQLPLNYFKPKQTDLNLQEKDSTSSDRHIFNDIAVKLSTDVVLNSKLGNSSLVPDELEACINLLDGSTCSAVPVLLTKCNNDQDTIQSLPKDDKNVSFSLCSDIQNLNTKHQDVVTVTIATDKQTQEVPSQYLAVGCINTMDTDYSHLEVCQTYLCHNVKDFTASGTLEHIYPSILQDLSNKQLQMVILSTGILPYLGILKPVSDGCALLSLYHIGSTLQIEKAMLKQKLDQSDNTQVSNMLPLPVKLSDNKATALGQQFHIKSLERLNRNKGIIKNKTRSYRPDVLTKWYLPGVTNSMEPIIAKLNHRLNDLEFLTTTEKKTLKSLQKFYRKQNQPPKLETSKPISDFNHMDENAMSAEDVTMTSEGGYSLRRQSSSTFSRTDIIMSRSKHVQKRKSSELPSASQKVKEETKPSVDLSNIDFETEEDVCVYIKDIYTKCIDNGESTPGTCIHTIVTLVLHYIKSKDTPQPEQSTVTLINNCIKMTNSKLREKYQGQSSDMDKRQKTVEYQLQILLILELESIVMSEDSDHIEECVDEIVNLLRTVSFIYEQSIVPKFLNDILVPGYSVTLPKLLVRIFDELMQPLPTELAGFASPDGNDTDQSLNMSHNDSNMFVEPSSNTSTHSDILLTQPTRRSRRVVHHPSLSDFGSKKQIMVAVDTKVTKEKKDKVSRTSSRPSKQKPKQNEAVKVRRNLFEGDKPKIDRRQSVAVMESIRRSPRKHAISSFKSPTAGSASPVKRLVAETPSHKQKTNAVWRQQERKRRRTNSKDGVKIVQESPMKAVEAIQEPEAKISPGRFRKKATVTRRSFYSASSTRTRPRNLSAYYNLGARISGRHRTFSQAEDKINQSLSQLAKTSPSKKFMSPTRSSRNFLMSQLMSPSPNKRSPLKITQSPSQRTRSKTPRKTPSRVLFESPRHRVQSPSKLIGRTIPDSPAGKTPKKQIFHPLRGTTPKSKTLVFETPEKNSSLTVSNTPTKTPKRTSPRFKVQQGNPLNKASSHLTSKSTDVSSTQNGQISPKSATELPGLSQQTAKQEISENVRTKGDSTPSKTPKSKSAKKCLMKNSPFRNTRSQGPVTPTRHSVCTALFTTSPPRTYVTPQIETTTAENSAVFKTPSKSLRLKSPSSTRKLKFVSPVKNATVWTSDDKSSNYKTNLVSPNKPTYIIRTPSPHDKNTKTKTPDSLDKWPRRKRRRESPCQKFGQSEAHFSIISEEKAEMNEEDNFNPMKRQRLQTTESTNLKSVDINIQNSTRSTSKGHFAAVNDFIRTSEPDTDKTYDDENCEYLSQKSPRDSPVFGSSPLRKKNQQKSLGLNNLMFAQSEESNQSFPEMSAVPFNNYSNNLSKSPVFKSKTWTSPVSKISSTPSSLDPSKEKKFSPSISSKSLIQLMNSPLLNKERSPSKKSALKSRKSLQLGE